MGIASVSSLSANFSVKSGGITPVTLWAQGDNRSGQLANNTTISRSSPIQLASQGIPSYNDQIIDGYGTVFLFKYNLKQLWGWGDDIAGVLGQNTQNSTSGRSSPVQIGAAITWDKMPRTTDSNSMAGIDSSGKLWVWGRNNHGQLGINTTTDRSNPVQMGSDNWIKVESGGSHKVAIKSDNTLWGWGLNSTGELGQVTYRTNRSSPVQIGTATNWTQIALASNATFLLNSDGEIWCMGANTYGELCTGDTIARSSPVQIPSGYGTWTNVICAGFASGAQMFGINSNGYTYFWGRDPNTGISGLGLNINRSAPTQIPGKIFSKLYVSSANALGMEPNGNLWTWGNNNSAQLGQLNNTINKSSPVQVFTNYRIHNAWFAGQQTLYILRLT
jgi:alpha-tubulin suppressor-like RCC1 family protein